MSPTLIRWAGLIGPYAIILLYFIQGPLAFGGPAFTDYFHEGEYFAGLSGFLHQNEFTPLIIHGLLDVLPGWVMLKFAGWESYALTTKLGYTAIHLTTCILGFRILGKFWRDPLTLSLLAVTLPSLLGYRDFGLILLMLQFFSTIQRRQSRPIIFWVSLGLLGVLGAFGLLYSSNRGLAGFGAIGLGILVMMVNDRRWLISVAAFSLTLLLGHFSHSLLSLSGYLENTWHFVHTSSQWSYQNTWETWFFKGLMGTLLIGTALFNVWMILRSRKKVDHSEIALAVCLLVLSGFYLQISTYRADAGHAAMGLYCVLLNIGFLRRINCLNLEGDSKASSIYVKVFGVIGLFTIKVKTSFGLFAIHWALQAFNKNNWASRWGGLALCLAIVAGTIEAGKNISSGRGYQWVSHSRADSVDPTLSRTNLWLKEQLVKHQPTCVFDMTNNGIVYAAVKIPPCTKFSYLIYGSAQDESAMMAALESKRPSMIISSATYVGYAIDNVPMSIRYPNLNKLIETTYPNQICHAEACVRTK